MGNNSAPDKPPAPFHAIFTDLDGTLLDHNTYEWKEAQPALDRCKQRGIPVIFVSSKTRAEMEPLREKMSISDPFIAENGGGIFFSQTTFAELPSSASPISNPEGLWKYSQGVAYPVLIKALQEIREESRLNLRGFSDMSIDEISHRTGLDLESSRLAGLREFDEPFIIDEKQHFEEKIVMDAARKRGLCISKGGRFYHLQGKNDKGQAMDVILSLYKLSYETVVSIALGDSPNDFPMLKRADIPILIRSQSDFPELKIKIPKLKITHKMGPTGWNCAVMDLLR